MSEDKQVNHINKGEKVGQKNEKKCYLASGWFTPMQMGEIQEIERLLFNMKGLKTYSPRLEANCPPTASPLQKTEVFISNITEILNCDLIIVNTRDKDMGTIFEAGCAFIADKPIIYFCAGLSGNFNLMLAQSGIAVATSIGELQQYVESWLMDNDWSKEYTGVIE